MFNPTRRNRNIGTAKQGHGQNNKYCIPQSSTTSKSFYELLGRYEKTEATINGHQFLFVVEQTRPGSQHACSVGDLKSILEHIPSTDYEELKLIVFRQPKRKEEALSPTWGRLIYSYEFEGEYHPAIILEAVDYTKKLKWPKALSIEEQQELERLRTDGHTFSEDGRHFTADLETAIVRQTQLYRTLLHEIGHYVHYLEAVERPATEDEDFEHWQRRHDSYFRIPQRDKEAFAHRYAESLRKQLIEQQVIPFEPI